jgi:hypothetical protein
MATMILTNLDPIEAAKRLASHMAVDRHVLPEHKVCLLNQDNI